jgi:DNA primase
VDKREEIRARVPLEDLLKDYGLRLIPSGRRLKALCPFHQEKTPSFSVDVEKQFYHCFGCQESGDIFSFVQAMDRVGFREALEMLARRAGVVLEDDARHGRGARRQDASQVLRLYDALAFAASYYHRLLVESPVGERARRYLRDRGIAEAMWRRFQLGYSPNDWSSLLTAARSKGFSAESLEHCGLAMLRRSGRSGSPEGDLPGSQPPGHFDMFRDRVMFPICDVRGRPIGFGARTLGSDQPKYLNTPKTALFDKSRVLYALSQAKGAIRERGELCIVEGYTDAIMAHQAGLEHFVASLGTAFTAENARSLKRHAARIMIVFDGDAAGQRATERSIELLVREDLDVRVYSVRDGKDPCDAILLLGGEEFSRRLNAEAVSLFEYKWRQTVESPQAAEGPQARARALDDFLRLLLGVRNEVTRKLILREYLERIDLSESDLTQRIRVLSRTAASFGGGGASAPVVPRLGLAGRAGLEGKASDTTGHRGATHRLERGLERDSRGGRGSVRGWSGGSDGPVPAPHAAVGLPPAGGARTEGSASQGAASQGAASQGAASQGPAPQGSAPQEPAPQEPAPQEPVSDLAELVVECVLAMPEKLLGLVRQLPAALFSSRAELALRKALEAQAAQGSFSAVRLAREIDEPDAQRVVIRLLNRIEDPHRSQDVDYEFIWRSCLRDVRRWEVQRQVRELEARRKAACGAGDSEKAEVYRKEILALWKEIKKGTN